MTAQICGGICPVQAPAVRIFSNQIFHSPRLALPFFIFPGTADCRNVSQPGNGRRGFFEFLSITEFPGPAGGIDDVEMVIAYRLLLSPVFLKRANVTYKRRDAGDRAKEKMFLVSAFDVERETALGNFAHRKLVTRLQFVEQRSEITLRNEFDEDFEFLFVWRGNNRISALHQLGRIFHAESGVLAGSEAEIAAGSDTDHPEVGSDIGAMRHARSIEFVLRQAHGVTLSDGGE